MDYFTETMLQQQGHEFHDIHLRQSPQQIFNMYEADGENRAERLSHASRDMIFGNRVQINGVLEDIIFEKFNCKGRIHPDRQ